MDLLEYKVLRGKIGRIKRSNVDPAWLAGELLAAKIIGDEDFQRAIDIREERDERLGKLVEAVMRNGAPGVFQTFARILLKEDHVKRLGEELKEEFTRVGGTWRKEPTRSLRWTITAPNAAPILTRLHYRRLHFPPPEVYKRKPFMYTGKEEHLLWEEYGVKLHFPSHTSQVCLEGTVSVLSGGDDSYILEVGSELVSAVYRISASKPLPVPVTVQVQHCIPLVHDGEAARLGMSFITAHTEEGPPYVFQDLDGGVFRSGSSYGDIQLTHFSDIAIRIKWWLGRPIPFFASVFYTESDKAKFVVTQNLAAHITAVKDAHRGACEQEVNVMADRHSLAIHLKEEVVEASNSPGKVTINPPAAEIAMGFVLNYRPGRAIPHIRLQIRWGEDKNIPVELTGVVSPKSFLLEHPQNTVTEDLSLWSYREKQRPDMTISNLTLIKYRVHNEEKEFRLLQKIAHKWESIGDQLGITADMITSHDTNEKRCRNVLRIWMQKGSEQYPVEWEGLIKVLKDVELRVVARELRKALDNIVQ